MDPVVAPPPAPNLQQRLLRTLFGAVAAACLAGVLAGLLLKGWPGGPGGRLMLLGYALLGLLSAGALRVPPARATQALLALVLVGEAMVGGLAVISGWGLQTPGLAFFPLVVCLTHVVAQPRVAWWVTALAASVVAALAGVERLGGLPTPGIGTAPLAGRLVLQLAALLTGALAGRAVAQVVQRHLAAAEEREQRFRTLLGIAATGYWETDAGLRLSAAWWRRRGGFTRLAAVLARAPWDLPGLAAAPEVLARLHAALAARQPLRDLPFTWQAPGGRLRHYLASGEPRHAPDGQFLGYWGVLRDVSAAQRARQALAATESRYRELFKHLPSPVTLHQGGVVVDANPAAARLLGYGTVEAMLGHHLIDEHVAPAQRDAVRARVAEIERMAPGLALPPMDIVLRDCQGRTAYVKTVGARADHLGRPATLSLSIDETGRRAAALALTRTQQMLAQVVAMSPDAITVTDLSDGRYVMVNERFTRLTGYAADEAVGHTARQIGIWRDARDREALLALITRDGSVIDRQVDFVAKDGRTLTLMVSGTRLDVEGQPYLLLSSRDVSEGRRERLEREAILANASVGIAFTRERRFVLANPQFEAIFGWTAGSLVGQPDRVVWASDADYAAVNRQVGPALGRGEAVDTERQALRHDGRLFTLRLRAKAIDPSRPADSGTIWIAEDVTAARQAEQELARARDAAEAANRAKSDFLANTSHEIRTPLNALQGLARLARQPGLPAERLQQYLDQIGDSADLLGLIISDILDLAKIEAGKLLLEDGPFALDAMLSGLAQSHAALAAARGLHFETAFDPALPAWVRGDALRVRQVLANFLSNALKFTAQGGIRLAARPLPGGRLRFEVHDTGPGIDAATQARLFRPFTQADESTTRRHGGTGLGLSICHELATLMGGQVGLDSTVGAGSCFHAELPLPALDAAQRHAGQADAGEARLRGARVLMVEDNSVNMMIGVAQLEQWGVQVLQAADGTQALAVLDAERAAGRRVDAVLMDVQMPGLSGYETTEAMRRRHPDAATPVIALTAAALVSERERALAAGMDDFLTKPIEPRRLHDALVRALFAHRPPETVTSDTAHHP